MLVHVATDYVCVCVRVCVRMHACVRMRVCVRLMKQGSVLPNVTTTCLVFFVYHFPSLFCSSAQVVLPLIAGRDAPGQVIKQQIKTPVSCCRGEASSLGTADLAASQPGI